MSFGIKIFLIQVTVHCGQEGDMHECWRLMLVGIARFGLFGGSQYQHNREALTVP